MPHFDDFYAAKLRGSLGVTDAESVLDLRGANKATAEASLKDMIERSRFAKGKTVAVRLDAPPEGGGETLFQPTGRLLLDAKRRGLVERLQTLPAQDGLGFYVALSGRAEKAAPLNEAPRSRVERSPRAKCAMISVPSASTLPGGRNTLERLARFGYGARGAVYVLVGGLALLAAFGGGRPGDSHDALRKVLVGPFGAVLVGLIALGLLAFAVWRAVEAVTDADRRGTSLKGLVVRGAHLVSAILYVGLAGTAASLSLGLGFGGGDGVHDGTAWLLSKPMGRWLVALVGLAIAATAFGYLAKAWRGDTTARLALDGETRRRWAEPTGRFGYAARGIAFLIIGGFVAAAAWHQSSAEAKGLGDAFVLLRAQPYGTWLLAIVAAGHAAFGAFGLIQARYRHIDAPDVDRVDDEAVAAARRLA